MFLYILCSDKPFYHNTFYLKVGITINIEARLSALRTAVSFNVYKLFTFNEVGYPSITKQQLLFLESMVLSATADYALYGKGAPVAPKEIRVGLTCEELFDIVKRIIDSYGFKYCLNDYVEDIKPIILLDRFQTYTVNEIINAFDSQNYSKNNNSVWFCYPTGGGKTVIAKHIIMFYSHITKVIVITPTIMLGKQYIKLFDDLPINVNVITYNRTYNDNVNIDLDENTFILYDEFHHITANTIKYMGKTPNYNKAKKLFCSATVSFIKDKSQKQIHPFYGQQINTSVSIKDLIDIGRLCPFEVQITYADDIDEKSYCYRVCEHLFKTQHKIMLFCKNIEECECYLKFLESCFDNSFGIFIQHGGNTKYENRNQLKSFADETNKCIMVSCRVLIEGIDMPDVDACIITYAATDKTSTQIIGRIIRNSNTEKQKHAICVFLTNDVLVKSANQVMNIMKILNEGQILYKTDLVKHYKIGEKRDDITLIGSDTLHLFGIEFMTPTEVYEMCIERKLYNASDYKIFNYVNNNKYPLEPERYFTNFKFPHEIIQSSKNKRLNEYFK